jgi:hypothetical protein
MGHGPVGSGLREVLGAGLALTAELAGHERAALRCEDARVLYGDAVDRASALDRQPR